MQKVRNTRNRLGLLGVTVFGALSIVATNANSALVNDGAMFDMYTLPDNSLMLDEQKIFINQAVVGQNEHLTGSIGENDGAVEAYWVSTDAGGLDGVGSGFATIKGGGGGLIHDITFGVYNSYFEDVIFSVIPENQQAVSFTVTGYFKDGSSESVDLTTQNGLENWLSLADLESNPFVELNITSTEGIYISGPDKGDETSGGFTQSKQWQVSGVNPIPIPAAAWLFGSALIGLIGVARRKKAA